MHAPGPWLTKCTRDYGHNALRRDNIGRCFLASSRQAHRPAARLPEVLRQQYRVRRGRSRLCHIARKDRLTYDAHGQNGNPRDAMSVPEAAHRPTETPITRRKGLNVPSALPGVSIEPWTPVRTLPPSRFVFRGIYDEGFARGRCHLTVSSVSARPSTLELDSNVQIATAGQGMDYSGGQATAGCASKVVSSLAYGVVARAAGYSVAINKFIASHSDREASAGQAGLFIHQESTWTLQDLPSNMGHDPIQTGTTAPSYCTHFPRCFAGRLQVHSRSFVLIEWFFAANTPHV